MFIPRVSLGQATVEGQTFDMSMLVPASNLDQAIGIGAAVLSIATTATRLGRSLVKKSFNTAKGKVVLSSFSRKGL